MLNIRHGLILVGSSFSGKSSYINVLQRALTALMQPALTEANTLALSKPAEEMKVGAPVRGGHSSIGARFTSEAQAALLLRTKQHSVQV
jgi:hypothetical protein